MPPRHHSHFSGLDTVVLNNNNDLRDSDIFSSFVNLLAQIEFRSEILRKGEVWVLYKQNQNLSVEEDKENRFSNSSPEIFEPEVFLNRYSYDSLTKRSLHLVKGRFLSS